MKKEEDQSTCFCFITLAFGFETQMVQKGISPYFLFNK